MPRSEKRAAMTGPPHWPPGAHEIEMPRTSRAAPLPTTLARDASLPPCPSYAAPPLIATALQELKVSLPAHPANSLAQERILRFPKAGQEQVLDSIQEIN